MERSTAGASVPRVSRRNPPRNHAAARAGWFAPAARLVAAAVGAARLAHTCAPVGSGTMARAATDLSNRIFNSRDHANNALPDSGYGRSGGDDVTLCDIGGCIASLFKKEPVDPRISVEAQLIKPGDGASMGMTLEGKACRIGLVHSGSAAEAAGLQVGDRIAAITASVLGTHHVKGHKHAIKLLQQLPPGTPCTLTLSRIQT